MKYLKWYAAIVTGILAAIISFAAMWFLTNMNIGGMIFTTVLVYLLGIGIVLSITEESEQKSKRRRHVARPYGERTIR